MGKRIGESTADDSHGWIFAERVYNWWCYEIPRYTGITVFLRRYIIFGRFLIPRITKWLILTTDKNRSVSTAMGDRFQAVIPPRLGM